MEDEGGGPRQPSVARGGTSLMRSRNPHKTLGLGLQKGPRVGRFLMSEVPLQGRTTLLRHSVGCYGRVLRSAGMGWTPGFVCPLRRGPTQASVFHAARLARCTCATLAAALGRAGDLGGVGVDVDHGTPEARARLRIHICSRVKQIQSISSRIKGFEGLCFFTFFVLLILLSFSFL